MIYTIHTWAPVGDSFGTLTEGSNTFKVQFFVPLVGFRSHTLNSLPAQGQIFTFLFSFIGSWK